MKTPISQYRAQRRWRARKLGKGDEWIGGNHHQTVTWQFQVLFLRYGFKMAIRLAEDTILWPSTRRPSEDHYLAWAMEVDTDQAQIPPNVQAAFEKRLDGMVKSAAEGVVLANAEAAVKLAKKAADGSLDESQAKLLVAANNGAGFVYREIIGAGQKKAEPQQNNFFLNAGPPPPKRERLRAARNARDIIEAPAVRVIHDE